MEVNGRNYLLPVGANIQFAEEVRVEAVDADYVLARMAAARNRLNVLILDACRNNPFVRSFRNVKNGLAQMNAPPGSIIAYSTGPGMVAADGRGQHSPYTQALLAELDRPGLTIEEVFKGARARVYKRTGGKQVPWESVSTFGTFYLKPGKAQAKKPIVVADSPGPKLGEVDQRKLKIQNLLAQAKKLFDANSLTTPAGASAFDLYKQVLSLDPMNAQARKGLKLIVGKYVDWAEDRIKVRDFTKAEKFLASAEKVSEGDERVLAARDKLREAKQKTESAEARERKKAEAERKRIAAEQARAEAAHRAREHQEAERRRKQASQAVERSSDGRYTKDSQGVITDSSTGLQWYVGPDKNTNWYDAKKWVESLAVAGGSWHLPTRSELRGLYQKGKGSRNMDPIFKTTGWWVWSGETSGPSYAWGLYFVYGNEFRDTRAVINYRAFAVRPLNAGDETIRDEAKRW